MLKVISYSLSKYIQKEIYFEVGEDELKEAYGVDLMNPTAIKKLMKTFFLLGFVIVDDSQELCHFIFDGDNNYQVVSFSGLEKENNSKNDFKEIYKLINSGRL